MAKSKFSYVIYFLIGLATFGFITVLIKNPSRLFLSILMTVVIAFVLFKIMSAVLERRQTGGNSDEMKKYRQAVKQSKAKYQQTAPSKIKQSTAKQKRKKRRRNAPHLRVIEGKKNKTNKNDRVL